VLKLIVTLSSAFAPTTFIASISTLSSDPPAASQNAFALHDLQAAHFDALTHAVAEPAFITIPS
jgi:hypothetical protein